MNRVEVERDASFKRRSKSKRGNAAADNVDTNG
jgi:hypothetical protein